MEQEIGNISIALIRKLNAAMKGIGNDFIMDNTEYYIPDVNSIFRYPLRLDKQPDMKAVLEKMGEEYGVKFTPEQEQKFIVASTFGVPMKSMPKFLDLPTEKQDRILKNEGIPCDSTDNQFKSWVRNARAVNSDLRIAIKADANTPYAVIKKVMNSL